MEIVFERDLSFRLHKNRVHVTN